MIYSSPGHVFHSLPFPSISGPFLDLLSSAHVDGPKSRMRYLGVVLELAHARVHQLDGNQSHLALRSMQLGRAYVICTRSSLMVPVRCSFHSLPGTKLTSNMQDDLFFLVRLIALYIVW